MTAYVALLRAVNLLGASTLRMTDLKAIAHELGLGSPRTLLASGNLLFLSALSSDGLRDRLEQRISVHFGRQVRVFVRTADEMQEVLRLNPFADVNPRTVQVFFLDAPPPPDLLSTVRNQDDERIACGTREVYVAYGEKGIGRSRARIPAAEAGTARNMNTVARLAELAREMS